VKLYRRGVPLIVGFEGWDAAGKGGAISRLTAALDARGFTVAPVSAPTPTELSHHYLWRFFKALPPKGHITIFDRTWYGRVMVERVEQLCSEPQWQRAYEEINRFEKLLADGGAILCKFWLQIDKGTQLARFEERKADLQKQWKLTDEDWRNREKWLKYEQAVDEVLQRTHTASAPWTVVEANDKDYARIKVLQTVVDTIEKHLNQDAEDED
jgi:polyphosphate kinase 2 (PPK2 family)